MKKGHLACGVLLLVVICGKGFPARLIQRAAKAKPPVTMRFVNLKFGKPPLTELYFDVVLRNNRAGPRWFLLPRNLSPDNTPLATKGGVDVLEVFAPKGKGRVIIGEFLGTGGFQALLLPPGAEVRLRGLKISFWGDLPDSLQVEIVVAKSLLIGGERASNWFGLDPASSTRADISEWAPDAGRHVRTKRTRDNKEVPTRIEEDRRLQVLVTIKKEQ